MVQKLGENKGEGLYTRRTRERAATTASSDVPYCWKFDCHQRFYCWFKEEISSLWLTWADGSSVVWGMKAKVTMKASANITSLRRSGVSSRGFTFEWRLSLLAASNLVCMLNYCHNEMMCTAALMNLPLHLYHISCIISCAHLLAYTRRHAYAICERFLHPLPPLSISSLCAAARERGFIEAPHSCFDESMRWWNHEYFVLELMRLKN